MARVGIASGNKAVPLREPPLGCDIVGAVPPARGRMDTWNAVSKPNRMGVRYAIVAPGGYSPPDPSASIPSGKGVDANRRRLEMRNGT